MKTNTLAQLAKFDVWNERILLVLFAALGIPRRYLDVGCGTAAMVTLARRMGVDAYGVDLLIESNGYLLKHDLRQPLRLGEPCDLVTCIEVAEHLPSESAEALCDTLAVNTSDGGYLVLSAAHPGQGGEGHVNCQPAYYWRELLHPRGLHYHQETTTQLELLTLEVRSPMMWVPANIQCFRK